MQFIVATRDYAGLGFAIRLQDEGHDVILAVTASEADQADPVRLLAWERVGCGLVRKEPLGAVFERRDELRQAYWIWDFNHNVELNETLRSEGFKVLGGGLHCDSMEHDRNACLEFASTYGLEAPPSFPFSDCGEAVRFCEQHPSTAYVYKPDEGQNFETFLPESEDPSEANFELRMHLLSLESSGSFILQERKEGVETNVEVWMQNGEPVFAFMALESKKRYTGDMGELAGCAFDFAWTIPLDCRAVTESVGRLYPAYRKMRYTGFADANFIAARDGVWFFEKCERFGYNAHPNLFWNLNLSTLGEVLSSVCDGTFRPRFSGGFGASVTMSTKDNPEGCKLIQFPEKLWKDIYWWDAWKRDGHVLTAGYDRDVLILTAYGYTMSTAWESLMRRAAQVKFPFRHYRIDGDRTDFPTSPLRRYEALKAMGLSMKINIETIPHGEQRYPTVGDYWDDPEGVVQVRVSDMKDWRYEALVVVHELIEMFLTKHRGIAEEAISDFDIRFERSKEDGLVSGEAGDHINAPYRSEHFFATNLERLFSAELGVDWFEYDKVVEALGSKK